jgi:PKHD-type hydroxylase|tara:strand:- start:1568 stop:2143 length:576 start_codon:yes stop_codon:yes gene_type:complete
MSLIQNNKFEFVIYKENFLSDIECDKLIQSLDTDELTDATIVGDYNKHPINKNVRKALNIDFHDENLFKRLYGAIRVANTQYFNYEINSIDTLRFLKYGVGGTYKWHVDMGRNETSTRKLTAIVQLSEEKDYAGGDFEFGITDKEGTGLITGNRTKGCLIVFPSFLSHRVTPITKGTRYSIITWMDGDTFV